MTGVPPPPDALLVVARAPVLLEADALWVVPLVDFLIVMGRRVDEGCEAFKAMSA